MKLKWYHLVCFLGATFVLFSCHARKNKCNTCPHWGKEEHKTPEHI